MILTGRAEGCFYLQHGLVLLLMTCHTLHHAAALNLTQHPAVQACLLDHEVCTELVLGASSLTGTLPPVIGSLTRLTTLDVQWNSISGTIPSEMGRLVDLQRMRLDRNDLTGLIPTEIGQLPGLKEMKLFTNRLSGEMPSELGRLLTATEIYLHSNDLTGTLPSELGHLGGLTILDLSGNRFTGTVPSQVGMLEKLQYWYMCCNELSGNLPSQVSQMTALRQMHLERNNLTGTIPPESGRLLQLSQISIGLNSINGSLPTELGGLAELLFMRMEGNQLTGALPTELGKLGMLTDMNLGANMLTGSIPAEFGAMRAIRSMDLSANLLSSTIPLELSDTRYLAEGYICLFNNSDLCGNVPAALQAAVTACPHATEGTMLHAGCPAPPPPPPPPQLNFSVALPGVSFIEVSSGPERDVLMMEFEAAWVTAKQDGDLEVTGIFDRAPVPGLRVEAQVIYPHGYVMDVDQWLLLKHEPYLIFKDATLPSVMHQLDNVTTTSMDYPYDVQEGSPPSKYQQFLPFPSPPLPPPFPPTFTSFPTGQPLRRVPLRSAQALASHRPPTSHLSFHDKVCPEMFAFDIQDAAGGFCAGIDSGSDMDDTILFVILGAVVLVIVIAIGLGVIAVRDALRSPAVAPDLGEEKAGMLMEKQTELKQITAGDPAESETGAESADVEVKGKELVSTISDEK
ncbi:hypothetical protein CYMTET_37923 [Cymbomonas tetramitiformis]|uniref:L domain-like protein n=1 Tax=Cymbomonas tetramitiformis TaxID=36881 RepID=A0AAE0CES3_9CHLO|nr:hypothetical protein CYMTET_37923 [Cymbomonas tetramitiformis]